MIKVFFFRECDIAEVTGIIKKLQLSKSCGPNSIPTNILKSFIELISPLLVILINQVH